MAFKGWDGGGGYSALRWCESTEVLRRNEKCYVFMWVFKGGGGCLGGYRGLGATLILEET